MELRCASHVTAPAALSACAALAALYAAALLHVAGVGVRCPPGSVALSPWMCVPERLKSKFEPTEASTLGVFVLVALVLVAVWALVFGAREELRARAKRDDRAREEAHNSSEKEA